MIVVLLLAALPAIERLVHHHYAHAVAQFQQFGRGRIMARANGVDAHLFQHLDLSLKSAPAQGRAEWAKVVMIADAFDADVLAVEEESPFGVELDGTYAEGGFI